MYIYDFYANHFAKVYLARCKKRTVDLYKQILNFWIDEIGNLEISKISPADCQEFVSVALTKVCPDISIFNVCLSTS